MSTIVQIHNSYEKIRVAVIIEGGKIKPVWFEAVDEPARDRVHIKEICSVWLHSQGASRIINFSVWDGANTYRLSLNTRDFTWNLGIVEETPFPSHTASSTWRFRRDDD